MTTRGAKILVKCNRCKRPFEARVADRKRGWARFCSKSCKAIKQTQSRERPKSWGRHDGHSEMAHKHCDVCGAKAVNGIYLDNGRIEWLCLRHMIESTGHPHSSESLGQW